MEDSIKYLIHARIVADGVVERTDVVGAVFGQTEGLLGDELEIRGLQESAKLGRIDVEIETENGQSFGTLTIGSALDKVETAILAAAFETIDRIGPCTADLEVTGIEDVRAAKRREVVERAKELLVDGFEDTSLTSSEIIEEVRESARPGSITEYAGVPAGSAVASSDAVILVEGRADVRRLVEAGINNVVAIEGTNVPDTVAELTQDRNATAFLDGDRGGDLILRELAQVAAVDHVARAPRGHAVEDLSRQQITTALREKVPLDTAIAGLDQGSDTGVTPRTDGSAAPPTGPPSEPTEPQVEETDTPPDEADDTDSSSVQQQAAAVIADETGTVRLLDQDHTTIAEGAAADAVDLIDDTESSPSTVILDGTVDQQIIDAAADADVNRVIARDRGEFVKQPATVRVHTNDEVQNSATPPD